MKISNKQTQSIFEEILLASVDQNYECSKLRVAIASTVLADLTSLDGLGRETSKGWEEWTEEQILYLASNGYSTELDALSARYCLYMNDWPWLVDIGLHPEYVSKVVNRMCKPIHGKVKDWIISNPKLYREAISAGLEVLKTRTTTRPKYPF